MHSLPSVEELKKLTPQGQVRYALRCAMRVRPYFSLEGKISDKSSALYCLVVDAAIEVGSQFLSRDFTSLEAKNASISAHEAGNRAHEASKAADQCGILAASKAASAAACVAHAVGYALLPYTFTNTAWSVRAVFDVALAADIAARIKGGSELSLVVGIVCRRDFERLVTSQTADSELWPRDSRMPDQFSEPEVVMTPKRLPLTARVSASRYAFAMPSLVLAGVVGAGMFSFASVPVWAGFVAGLLACGTFIVLASNVVLE